jgi:hypothetical protein
MLQPSPNVGHTNSRHASSHAVRTFQTCPDFPLDLVMIQLHSLEDLRTKSRGRGATHPPLKLHAASLFHFPPFSWIMKEVVRGLTAPLSVRKFRMGSRGLKPCVAACQVGWAFKSSLSETSCLPAEVAGQFRS